MLPYYPEAFEIASVINSIASQGRRLFTPSHVTPQHAQKRVKGVQDHAKELRERLLKTEFKSAVQPKARVHKPKAPKTKTGKRKPAGAGKAKIPKKPKAAGAGKAKIPKTKLKAPKPDV